EQVRVLADLDGADGFFPSHVDGAVQSCDANRLNGREAGLDQKLDLSMIAETRDDTAATGRITPGDQQSPGLHEREFHGLAAGKDPGPLGDRFRGLSRGPVP